MYFKVRIILCYFIASILLFTSIPWNVSIAHAEESATTSSTINLVKDTGRKEIPELRTETSKTYKYPDGTYKAEVMTEPIHYKVGDKWEDIDNTLIPSSNNQDYENKSNKFKVKFNKNISEQSKRLLTYQVNNQSVDFEIYQNQKPLNSVLGDANTNQINYKDAYKNVSYDYKVDGSKVKENIVLNSYPDTNTFKFFIKGTNLTAKKQDDGKIYFYDKDTNEFQFFIQKPFMYDSESNKGNEPNVSQNVTQDISETSGGFILTVTADDAYLKDPNRVYPVTIDPWIDVFQPTDTYIASKSTANYSNDANLSAGYDATLGHTRTLMRWDTLPALPPDSEVAGGSIGVVQSVQPSDSNTKSQYLYRLTQPYTASTVTYASQPAYSSTAEDSQSVKLTGYTYFRVDALIKGWYDKSVPNNGVILKYLTNDENALTPRRQYYSSQYTGDNTKIPKLVINYRPKGEYGNNDYWTYTPNLFTTDGEGKVNVGTGNLVYSTDLFSMLGRTDAFNLSITYNSQSNYDYGVGYGWVLNAGRRLITSPLTNASAIVYIDDTGTRYDFTKTQSDTANTYTTPSGTHFKFTVVGSGTSAQYQIQYPDKTNYIFDSIGRIYQVVDENQNIITYSYKDSSSSQLVKISERNGADTTGKDLILTYDGNNQLWKITDPRGTDTTLTYTNAGGKYLLASITKGSNRDSNNSTSMTFRYDVNNMLETITDAKNYSYQIAYVPNPDDSSIQVVKSVTDPKNQLSQLNYTPEVSTTLNYYKGLIKTCEFTDKRGGVTRYTNSVDSRYLVLNTTEITTDVNGSPSTTKYTWDGNEIVEVFEPNKDTGAAQTSASETNTYNPSGYLDTSKTNTGITTDNDFASNNDKNVTSTKVNDVVTNSSIFDQGSNTVSAADAFSTSEFSQYDKYGNTISSTNGTAIVYNRIKNSSFEYADASNFPVNWFHRTQGSYAISSTDSIIGNKSMGITLSSSDGAGYLYTDKIPVDTDESDGSYTVSGYIKTTNLTGLGANFLVYFYDVNNQLIKNGTSPEVRKSQYVNGTNGWTKISYSFTVPAGTKSMQFDCNAEGVGTAYFDAVQLSYGQVVPAYSANENTSFEWTSGGTSLDNWTLNNLNTGDGYSTVESHRGKSSLRLTSNSTFSAYSGQTIEMNGKQGDPVTFSGWSDNSGAVSSGGDYELRLLLENTDGTEDRFDLSFNKNVHEWQLAKDTIRAKKDFKQAKIYAYYANQPLCAYFDNVKVEAGSSKSLTTYDADGLLVNSNTDPLNNITNYGYDANGNQTSITSSMGKKTSFAYDYLNRLTSTTLINTSDTDPSNIQVQYTYDPVGNLSSRINPLGYTTNYKYNEFNQLQTETDPLGKYSSYSYDNNGNVTGIVKGMGATTTSSIGMKYNAQNQLSERDLGNGSLLESYAYDGANNLSSITLPDNSKYSYGYDSANRQINATYPDGYGVQYDYNASGVAAGLLSSITETMNGGAAESTSYSYNTLNALTNVTRGSGSAQWIYDKDGQPVQIQLGSNNVFQSFDDNGQLTSQKYYLPTTVTFQNTYDKDGNILTSSDGTQTNTYTYDFANRLHSWNNGTATTTFNYDKAGNLSNPSGKNLTFNAANEIDGYTYDGAGNLTQDDKYKYTWNDLGQLTSVQTLSGTQVASYTYYPDGLRKTKTVGSTTYTYYYNNGNLIRVMDNSGKVLWRITWGNGKPMFLTDSTGTTYYYVTNYRGDVIQIVDASGNKVADYSYDPWGNVLSTNESASVANQPLGYASYVYDREISQYYLQARYYKPADGVFLSRDPVAGTQKDLKGQNGYSYGNNNPVKNIDPTGNFIEIIVGGIAGAAITAISIFLEYYGEYGTISKAWSHMKKDKYSIAWQITQGFVAGAIGYGVVDYLGRVAELRPLFKAILGLHLSFPAYAIGVSWKDYSMSSLLENTILSQFDKDQNALYAALKAYRSHH